jgi:tetratricopeptide (TPR) repeat protein
MARSPPASAGSSNFRPLLEARATSSAVLLALAVGGALAPSTASAARSCADWQAELIGVEGTVAVRRAGTTTWSPATEHAELCFGDSVRSESFSRATVVLPDDTTMRLDALTTMTLDDPPSGFGTLVDLLLGALHIMSRDPRSLTIRTPHVNAGLEGTEFDIRVAQNKPETDVAVLEGAVRVTNATGVVSVPSGNVAAATANGAPVITPTRAVDLMRWASYYQPLFVGKLPSPSREPTAAEAAEPAFFAMRAAARLRYGRLDDAGSDLAALRALAPGNPLGPALEAVIALARGDQAGALASAERARDLDASSVPALLALAYAQEEGADLAGAARTIDSALALEPGNALVWTRHAVLAVGRGDAAAALASAERATALAPDFAAAHAALGFTYSNRADYERAIRAFERSIKLDQSAPSPRVGLGLALLAKGERRAGRRQLEIAATLDPADGMIRAYLSKAYDAEHRDKLTVSQIELAKDLAPSDPTGWLYQALGTPGDNRPIEGLANLRAAATRNGYRPPFRSRFFVDSDLATRSTGANSHIYRELGFEQVGLLEGLEATAQDPADYAGHRLLSGLYSQLPRGEIARVSEVLLATLLEPATLAPIQPQLGQPALFIADSVGPSALASTELAPVLTENGLRFQSSIVDGTYETFGEDVAIAGLHDRTSFSVGQYRSRSDGFRENNDFDDRIANAELKFRATPSTMLLAELRLTDTDMGHLPLFFDPAFYSPLLRIHQATDSVRLGMAHQQGERDTLIASVLALRSDSEVTEAPGKTELRGDGLDLQHIHRADRWRLQSGAAFAERNESPTDGSTSAMDFDLNQAAVYAYAHVDVSRALQLTVGASTDRVDTGPIDERALNPKLGVVWHASPRLTVRAAAFQTLEGSLSSSQQAPQPRLEPTEIAGFTQFLFGASNGAKSRVSGVGADLAITPRSFAGLELARRRTETPVTTFGPTRSDVLSNGDEAQERAYLYWTPTQKLSMSAEYQHDRFEESLPLRGFTDMRIRRIPLELRYFGVKGLTAGVRASLVDQEGTFLFGTPPVVLPGHGEDTFTVVDASLGYRLPNRRGVLSLNVANLFDKDFRFQDVDASNPSIMPERMAYLRFTFAFD